MNINEIATKQDIEKNITELKDWFLEALSEHIKSAPKFSDEDIITEEQVLEMLGIAKPTLYGHKSAGNISYFRPAGSNRAFYRVKDVRMFQLGIKHSSQKELEAEADKYVLEKKRK